MIRFVTPNILHLTLRFSRKKSHSTKSMYKELAKEFQFDCCQWTISIAPTCTPSAYNITKDWDIPLRSHLVNPIESKTWRNKNFHIHYSHSSQNCHWYKWF